MRAVSLALSHDTEALRILLSVLEVDWTVLGDSHYVEKVGIKNTMHGCNVVWARGGSRCIALPMEQNTL